MNPEEKELLSKTLRLSEENNRILRKMQRAARWAVVWGFIKFVIIVTPLIVGFLYLEPHVRDLVDEYEALRGALGI